MNKKVEILSSGNKFFYIDNNGRDFELTREEATLKVCEGSFVVKVEGLEGMYPEAKTVHCFISPKGAITFPYHADPVNLQILCISGEKHMYYRGDRHIAKEGESLHISRGTAHCGVNVCDSIALSIEL